MGCDSGGDDVISPAAGLVEEVVTAAGFELGDDCDRALLFELVMIGWQDEAGAPEELKTWIVGITGLVFIAGSTDLALNGLMRKLQEEKHTRGNRHEMKCVTYTNVISAVYWHWNKQALGVGMYCERLSKKQTERYYLQYVRS